MLVVTHRRRCTFSRVAVLGSITSRTSLTNCEMLGPTSDAPMRITIVFGVCADDSFGLASLFDFWSDLGLLPGFTRLGAMTQLRARCYNLHSVG